MNTEQTDAYYAELGEMRDQIQNRIDQLDNRDGNGRTIAQYFHNTIDDYYDIYCSECKKCTLTVNELLEIPYEPYVCYACSQPDEVKKQKADKKKWSATVEIIHRIQNGIAHDGVDPQELVERIEDLNK